MWLVHECAVRGNIDETELIYFNYINCVSGKDDPRMAAQKNKQE